MYHFAADRTRKTVTQAGVIFTFFAPMSALLNPDDPRLYGIMLEVPSDVSEDFDIDVKLNGDTIFAGTPPTFAVSSNIQFIMLDIDAPDVAAPIEVGLFEEITIEALTLPTGGIPAGMKASLVFDDQAAAGGGVAEEDMIAAIEDAIAAHEAASNPHPQYLTEAEADLLYEAIGGGGGGVGIFSIDGPPASPHAANDEFPGAALDAQWTRFQGAHSTLAVQDSLAYFDMAPTVGDKVNGFFQAVPSGDWTIIAKLLHWSPYASFDTVGLGLFQDATNNPNTTDVVVFTDERWSSVSHGTSVPRFSDYQTYSTDLIGRTVLDAGATTVYQKIVKSGTNYSFYISYQGLYWVLIGTIGSGSFFVPAEFGVLLWNSGSGYNLRAAFDWIRVYATDPAYPGAEI